MVRKSFCLILIGLFVLLPGQLLSLGLGDIQVSSALNQPLNAQINLISARPEELDEMRVELAPADVFDRVGVPRPYFLTQLKFKPVSISSGGTAIRVTSTDPVKEPFLTFLVEVTWPKGRLLREYTVLLDPPEFAQQAVPPVAAPRSAPEVQVESQTMPEVAATPEVQEEETVVIPDVQEEVVQAEESETLQPEVEIAEPEEDLEELRAKMDRALGIDHSEPITPELDTAETEPTAEELEEAVIEETTVAEETVLKPKLEPLPDWDALPDIEEQKEIVATDGDYVVQKGDTLSQIAGNARVSEEMTLNQMMLAIQQANPDAFIKENINLVKTGSVLRMPSADEVSVMSAADARVEVSKQNALWREYRGQVTQQLAAANVDAPDLVEETEVTSSELASEAEQVLEEVEKVETTQAKQDLNILAAEDSEEPATSPTQLASGEEVQKLQNELQNTQKELTVSKELVQSRDKENDELRSRVEALESMLEKKDKIINIHNQQLNDLQQKLSIETDKATAAEKLIQDQQKIIEESSKAAEETPETTTAPEITETVAEEIKEIQTPTVEPLPELEETTLAEQTVLQPKLEPLPDWESLPEIEVQDAEQPTEEEEPVVAQTTPEEAPEDIKQPEPTQPEVTQPQEPVQVAETAESGIMATLSGVLAPVKEHWTKLAAGLGALAILGGLVSMRRRKSAERLQAVGMGMPETLDDDQFDDILDETIVTPTDEQEDVGDVAFKDEAVGDTGSDAVDSDTAKADATPDDVIEEADVYISYGLHQQAIDLLKDAIAKEPNRKDYVVKMAEVYYSQKDESGLEEYATTVKDTLGESSSEWQSIMVMGKELAPSSALFAGAAAAAADVVAEKPETTDLDVGSQSGINESFDEELADAANDSEDDLDAGLDFDISEEEVSFDDDPVASKIMEANETSDILNFEVDDFADDLADEIEDDTAIQEDDAADQLASGIHEATGLHETNIGDLTEELEDVGMHTTMDDLKSLDMDGLDSDDTVAHEADDELSAALDTMGTSEDPDATAAYIPKGLDDDTEQFDAGQMDTEFLDPAEATIAQTATDLDELGPPSLIEEVGTKLDLAKAFVDMGDSDAAKETLLEVINEGDESQIKAAKDLMDKLGG